MPTDPATMLDAALVLSTALSIAAQPSIWDSADETPAPRSRMPALLLTVLGCASMVFAVFCPEVFVSTYGSGFLFPG